MLLVLKLFASLHHLSNFLSQLLSLLLKEVGELQAIDLLRCLELIDEPFTQFIEHGLQVSSLVLRVSFFNNLLDFGFYIVEFFLVRTKQASNKEPFFLIASCSELLSHLAHG